MATGDLQNCIQRFLDWLPQGWTGSDAPVINALATGFGTNASFLYSLFTYSQLQMRVQTATGDNLDAIANDFFGDTLLRNVGESDALYRERIQAFMVPLSATREAMIVRLQLLTGYAPRVFEPRRNGSYLGVNTYVNQDWRLGSRSYPFTVFIEVYRKSQLDPKVYMSLRTPRGYLGKTSYLGSRSLEPKSVSTQNIFDLVNRTRAAGVVTYVAIVDL